MRWVDHISVPNFDGGAISFLSSQLKADDQWYSLGDVELLQFTGLLDKNGKEIYEGDMVKTKRNAVYAVEWTSFEDSTMGYGEGVGFNIHEDDNCEVIGNIYENPNLLPL